MHKSPMWQKCNFLRIRHVWLYMDMYVLVKSDAIKGQIWKAYSPLECCSVVDALQTMPISLEWEFLPNSDLFKLCHMGGLCKYSHKCISIGHQSLVDEATTCRVVDVSGCTVLLLCWALGEVEDCRRIPYTILYKKQHYSNLSRNIIEDLNIWFWYTMAQRSFGHVYMGTNGNSLYVDA